ncbi:MAG: hypothetical protein ACFN04_03320 [Propionibacterium acidifaciens]
MTFDWAVRGWAGPGRAVTVGSGRQALGLLARWCRGNGIGTVLAPAFCCPTMVTPFWLEGMSVRFTAVDERLVMAAGPLRTARAGLDGPVAVLVARTGGAGPSTALRAELARMRRRGDLVIDDATHAVLADLAGGGRPDWCDASVASLRKLLPVPDGALLRVGDGIDVDPVGPATGGAPDRGPVSRRELPALFDAPHRPVPDGALAHLDALARAEARFDASLSPAPPCPATLRTLARLDWAGLARRTAANSRVLARALAGSGVGTVNPGVPAPLLVRVRDAAAVDAELAAHGVFSPMDWARPDAVDEALWPDGVLALDTRPVPGAADAVIREWLRRTAGVIRDRDPGE